MQVIEHGLVPIYETDESERLVNARELHEALKNGRHFSDWIKQRIDEAMLEEDADFIQISFSQNCDKPLGGRPSVDYGLTLDAAKQVAMLERNDVGRQVRKYFVEAEKKARNPVANLTRKDLLKMALETEEDNERLRLVTTEQTKVIKDMKPKVEVYDQFIATKSNIHVGVFAKVIGWGQNKLFAELRNRGILYRRNGSNIPKQQHIDCGRFTVKETVVKGGGEDKLYCTPLITPKGQEWLIKQLGVEVA